MDKPMLIIEAPELSDEAATIVRDFLYDIASVFESHYYHRRKRHYQRSVSRPFFNETPEE